MARGIDNCNPGNIRHSAERFRGEVRPSRDRHFKQFRAMKWGYRAMFVILNTYRTRYGLRTLSELIGRWAPPAENDTEAYISAVERETGIAAHLDLDPHHPRITDVVAAMSLVENGVRADMRAVEEGWRLFLADERT